MIKSNSAKVFMLFLLLGVFSALIFYTQKSKRSAKMIKIENTLTEDEKEARVFTPEVLWKMSRIGGAALSPDGKRLIYPVTNYRMEENRGITNLWMIDLTTQVRAELTDATGNESDVQWSVDGKRIFFMSTRSKSAQVWSISPDGKELKQETDIVDGIDGYKVAPDGGNLLYIKGVQVEQRASSAIYPDMDKSKAKIYDDLMVRHWDYWDEGIYKHIFVAKRTNAPIVEGTSIMKEDEAWDVPMAPYFEMSDVAWNNEGTQIAYSCKKMTGKKYAISTNSDVYLYDLISGATRNLTEGMGGYDRYPVFAPNDNWIAFSSMERNGNESDKARLFVVNPQTNERRYLTGNFDFNASDAQWEDNNTLLFISPIEATHQICRVTIAGNDVKVITAGDHDVQFFSYKNKMLIAGKCSLSAATELYEVNTDDGTLTQVTHENKEIYAHIKMGEVQKRWISTSDGKKMLTWVILPPDFDPNKKYPTLLYCQGGPQSVVSQAWSYRWNYQLMAAKGYIVVAPNRRGLPSFGQEWLDQISGDYSGQNIRDYLAAIDDVAKEPYVDAGRLGCVGASYGGYSTYFLAGNHNGRFKAFISHCGMFNFESFYGSTEELWFPNNDLGGNYWDANPTAQRSYSNSPHKFVKNWDTPILIIVGLNDYRIPYTESLQAFTAARLKGVPARLVAFENEAHQVFKPQNSIVWNREFFGWLDKYLK